MVSAINWESSPSLTSYLTTELNSLANGSGVLGGEIDNSSGLDTHADIEVYVHTQGGARSAGAHVDVYLIPTPDGTNYADYAHLPANLMVVAFPLDAATTARRLAAQMIWVPPGKFKLYVVNNTGQAFATTTSTMGYRLYSLESQ